MLLNKILGLALISALSANAYAAAALRLESRDVRQDKKEDLSAGRSDNVTVLKPEVEAVLNANRTSVAALAFKSHREVLNKIGSKGITQILVTDSAKSAQVDKLLNDKTFNFSNKSDVEYVAGALELMALSKESVQADDLIMKHQLYKGDAKSLEVLGKLYNHAALFQASDANMPLSLVMKNAVGSLIHERDSLGKDNRLVSYNSLTDAQKKETDESTDELISNKCMIPVAK